MFRRRRKLRKVSLKQGTRRFLSRCRRTRIVWADAASNNEVDARRLFYRRAARKYAWLSRVHARAQHLNRFFVKSGRRQAQKRLVPVVARHALLSLLRASLRSRVTRYRALRRLVAARVRRKLKYCRRVRRSGRRRRSFFKKKRGKKRFLIYRDRRKNRRQLRNFYKLQRMHGRTWAR